MSKTETVWDQYWTKENTSPSKDDAMCLFLATIILQTVVRTRGKNPKASIEMGAGSGRTSRYLNLAGSETAILDISSEALKLARYANVDVLNPTQYIEQNIFEVSVDNIGQQFDLVWNAGVLEHFSPTDQTRMIDRMSSLLSKDGLLLFLTPYSHSLFYRMGKFILERLNSFKYGQEIPVKTIKPILPTSVRLTQKEYSVGFIIFFFNGFKAISHLPYLEKPGRFAYKFVNSVSVKFMSQPLGLILLLRLDRILSYVFGGYLLLSVAERVET